MFQSHHTQASIMVAEPRRCSERPFRFPIVALLMFVTFLCARRGVVRPSLSLVVRPLDVMREKLPTILAYLFLAFCGLCVPLAHHRWAEQAIESTRVGGGLLPGPFHLFRGIGSLTWLLPVPAFVAFLLSLRFGWFRTFEGVCVIAICMFICASLYAAYCLFLLHFIIVLRAA